MQCQILKSTQEQSELHTARFQSPCKEMPFFKKAQSDRSQPKVTTLKLPWTKKIKPEVIAFTIDNVMTKEECDAWIAETEEQGYQFALLNTGVGQVYDPEHRNSKRCIQGIFFWPKLFNTSLVFAEIVSKQKETF